MQHTDYVHSAVEQPNFNTETRIRVLEHTVHMYREIFRDLHRRLQALETEIGGD